MAKSIAHLETGALIGLDLAKTIFQLHGVDASGAIITAWTVRRIGWGF